jgi:hypothetical protein
VLNPKRASQFLLKLTKDEKQLDKTWNLPGVTRQFRIYGYKANQKRHIATTSYLSTNLNIIREL